tara:strand:- start:140 stop:646 length:507 start_codon:yes stop_codon:yes gene_type:complete
MSSKIFKSVGVYDMFNVKLTSETFLMNVRKAKGGWELACDVDIYLCFTKYGVYDSHHIRVSKGEWWDGASIPKVFRFLVGDPQDTQFALASFVHDYLYGVRYNRLVADECFYHLLHDTKFKDIPAWKEQAMYAAVRVGGQSLYAVHSNPKSLIDKAGKSFWKLVSWIL